MIDCPRQENKICPDKFHCWLLKLDCLLGKSKQEKRPLKAFSGDALPSSGQ